MIEQLQIELLQKYRKEFDSFLEKRANPLMDEAIAKATLGVLDFKEESSDERAHRVMKEVSDKDALAAFDKGFIQRESDIILDKLNEGKLNKDQVQVLFECLKIIELTSHNDYN